MSNKSLFWLFTTITFYVMSTYILLTFDKTLGVVVGFINISGVVLSIPIFVDGRFNGEKILEIFGIIELSLTFSLLLVKFIL